MDVETLASAAHVLVEIAGPATQHIEMSRSGPKKYYSVARPLTLEDARLHLRGVKTKGALCRRPDGQTRALAYDADDMHAWQQLQAAARTLAQEGYVPLLEPSPAGRGGHLWIIFAALVHASAAQQQVQQIAPALAQIAEYWPGPHDVPGWNRIRLPGGRYVSPEVAVWCKLYDATGQELSRDGAGAARVLLTMQTDASLVPSIPSVERPAGETPQVITLRDPVAPRDGVSSVTPIATPRAKLQQFMPPVSTGPTQAERFFWFRYRPEQLAAWFNARHTLDELHPREQSGMAFSPSVSERTPSTGYHETPEGERWTDFSVRARRADGNPDGGDALELYVRLQGGEKAAVLRELGREMIREARTELEAAARSRRQPPTWVSAMMTPAGWDHYQQIAQAHRQHHTFGQDDEMDAEV